MIVLYVPPFCQQVLDRLERVKGDGDRRGHLDEIRNESTAAGQCGRRREEPLNSLHPSPETLLNDASPHAVYCAGVLR